MNMQTVIKVNNKVCERIGQHHARMYGRKVRITKHAYITNHIYTGKFHSVKLISN